MAKAIGNHFRGGVCEAEVADTPYLGIKCDGSDDEGVVMLKLAEQGTGILNKKIHLHSVLTLSRKYSCHRISCILSGFSVRTKYDDNSVRRSIRTQTATFRFSLQQPIDELLRLPY